MAGNVDPKIQKYFYAGIAQDKYLPIKNSCADAKGVDIFGGDVILGTHNQSNVITLPNNSYPTSIGDIITSNNGYIYDLNGNMIYDISNTTGYTNVRNYIDHTISGVTYRLLIASKFIHRYTPDALYTYSDLDGGGTNRAFDGSYIVHTAGSTVAFTGSNTAVVSTQYILTFSVTNRTAGSFTVKIGNDTPQTVSANGDYVLHFTAGTTDGVVITPSSDFNGKIYTVGFIGESTMEEAYIELTNTSSLAPAIVDQGDLYIGNGNIIALVDNTGVKIDTLVLPKNEEVVEITRDENYIIIWARSNNCSKVYFWDGVSEKPAGYKLWKNDIIQAVENQGDFCVAITGGQGKTKKIRKTTGYERQLILYVPYGDWETETTSNTGIMPALPICFSNVDSNGNNINTNNMSSFGDMVFIPSKDSVIVYGRKNPGLPFAFVNQYPLIDASDIYTIYAVGDTLYIGYNDYILDDAKIVQYKIENIRDTGDETNLYGNRGYVTTLPIKNLGTDINYSINLMLGQETPADTFMAVFYKINNNISQYTVVIDTTLNPVTVTPTVGAVYRFSTVDRMTVTKVEGKYNYMYISFEQTVAGDIGFRDRQISKVSGTGDNTLDILEHNNYTLLGIVDGSLEMETTNRDRQIAEKFTEIEFRVEMVTTDGTNTPIFKDLTLYYDQKPNG